MRKFKVMGEYDFTLLDGEATQVTESDKSYYQYMNSPRAMTDTANNVQCASWLLRNVPEGCTVEEPFGGVGIFATMIQHQLKPSRHWINDLDEGCIKQLKHQLGDRPGVEITQGDASDLMGRERFDVSVLEIPIFHMRKFVSEGIWKEELRRVFNNEPDLVVITDGAKFRYANHYYHTAKALNMVDLGSDPATYLWYFSRILHKEFGYSIYEVSYHGRCFYYSLIKRPPEEILSRYLWPGNGKRGLVEL